MLRLNASGMMYIVEKKKIQKIHDRIIDSINTNTETAVFLSQGNFHRITEWPRLERTHQDHSVQPLAQAESSAAGCPKSCPVRI